MSAPKTTRLVSGRMLRELEFWTNFRDPPVMVVFPEKLEGVKKVRESFKVPPVAVM